MTTGLVGPYTGDAFQINGRFDIDRYRKFIADCKARGIGIPSKDRERREQDHAASRPDQLRAWGGSMSDAEDRLMGSVPWFDPTKDKGALRTSQGAEDHWQARAELAEDLLESLERQRGLEHILLVNIVMALEDNRGLLDERTLTRLRGLAKTAYYTPMRRKAEAVKQACLESGKEPQTQTTQGNGDDDGNSK